MLIRSLLKKAPLYLALLAFNAQVNAHVLDGNVLNRLHPLYDGRFFSIGTFPSFSGDGPSNTFAFHTVAVNDSHNHHSHGGHGGHHHHSHTQWDFNIFPLIFTDTLSYRTVINEEAHFAKPMSFQDQGGLDFGTPELIPSTEYGKFRAMKKTSIKLGVGVSGTFTNDGGGALGGVIPSVGLTPVVGTQKVTERWAETRLEAEEMPHLPVPETAEEMLEWNLGDKVSYQVSGGLFVLGTVNFFSVYAGASYYVEGAWTKTIEKISPTQVYVELERSRLSSGGMIGGQSFVNMSLAKLEHVGKSVSFIFDLAQPDGAAALAQLMKGDARKAQKVADFNGVSGVYKVKSNKSFTKGRVKSVNIGIPMVMWSRGTGEITTTSLTDFHTDGSKADARYGMYVHTTDGRAFTKYVNTMYGFYGNHYEVENQDGTKTSGFSGHFGFSYLNSKGTLERMQDQIQNLIARTGFARELSVALPSVETDKASVEVQFLFNISQNATQFLFTQLLDNTSVLERISDGFVEQYFAHGDVNGLCRTETSVEAGWCMKKFRKSTRKAVKDMHEALYDMRNAHASYDRDGFVKAYAEFGKAMLENQFTFQSIFHLVKAYGVNAYYKVSGSEFKKYELSFDWKPVSQQF